MLPMMQIPQAMTSRDNLRKYYLLFDKYDLGQLVVQDCRGGQDGASKGNQGEENDDDDEKPHGQAQQR